MEGDLRHPKNEKLSEDGGNFWLKYGVSTVQGSKPTMAVAHVAFCNLDASTSFFAIYDGHCGEDVSKLYAEFFHEQLLKNEADDLPTSLRKAFQRMYGVIHDTDEKELATLKCEVDKPSADGESSPKPNNATGLKDSCSSKEAIHSGLRAGSAACVAVIRNNQVTVATVGEFRCIMSHWGKAHDLSKGRKPDIDAARHVQYGEVNDTLNLARTIGAMELKENNSSTGEQKSWTMEPYITTVNLSEHDDFLVIACHAIWSCMSSDDRLVEFVNKHVRREKKLSLVCERILKRCLAPFLGQASTDNVAAILVQFKETREEPLEEWEKVSREAISHNKKASNRLESFDRLLRHLENNSTNPTVAELLSCLGQDWIYQKLKKDSSRINAAYGDRASAWRASDMAEHRTRFLQSWIPTSDTTSC